MVAEHYNAYDHTCSLDASVNSSCRRAHNNYIIVSSEHAQDVSRRRQIQDFDLFMHMMAIYIKGMLKAYYPSLNMLMYYSHC